LALKTMIERSARQMESPPPGYRPHDARSLRDYLVGKPALAARLGGTAALWRIEEVGDGNLNLVFLIRGPAGSLCAKQALPYVRLVGESWPLPLSRAHFEHIALVEEAKHAPDLVPAVHLFDPVASMTIMDCLDSHIIMRKGMIKAVHYPRFATDIARFLAETLFRTSDLALPAGEKKRRVAELGGNTMLWKITEDLIFTDPYRIAELNRWTAPQLDADAAAIRADVALKIAVSELKEKFLCDTEAMIHGDLHTGSIMVTEDSTKVIDPEFVMYGPMGFDTGAVIGNLLLSYFSQDGHAEAPGARRDYQEWILAQTEAVWTEFAARFLALWNGEAAAGNAYPKALFADEAGRRAFAGLQYGYMRRLFADTLGFAAAKMIRRILGLAHVLDLESIKDPDRRAQCERRALHLARALMVERARFGSIGDVTQAARDVLRAGS
jgi:5-methylthioribose kinase